MHLIKITVPRKRGIILGGAPIKMTSVCSILMPPRHSTFPEMKVTEIAAGQEIKNSVFAGTLTQPVAQINSRVVTSTFVFTVPLLSIRARVRVPRTLRKAKNEPIL